MRNYETKIAEYANCLEVDGKDVSGMFYGFALDGAILRLLHYFPEIPERQIVDDLIEKRRELHNQNKGKQHV